MEHLGRSRTLPVLVLLVLLSAGLVAGQVGAQIDERARELLEAHRPQAEVTDYRTVQQIVLITMYDDDGTVDWAVRVQIALDFENHRMSMVNFRDNELNFKVVYADGESLVYSPDTGIRPYAFAGQDETYAQFLDQRTVNPFEGIEAATYDGFHSYAGLVAGEQVTITEGFLDLPGANVRPFKLLFDEPGVLVASVVEPPEIGTVITVYDTPLSAHQLVDRPQDYSMYVVEDGEPRLVQRVSTEEIRFDELLDESLFDLEDIPGG